MTMFAQHVMFSTCRERYIHTKDPNAVDENHTYLASRFDPVPNGGSHDDPQYNPKVWQDTNNNPDADNIFNWVANPGLSPGIKNTSTVLVGQWGPYVRLVGSSFSIGGNRVLGMNAGTKEMYLRIRYTTWEYLMQDTILFTGADAQGQQIELKWIWKSDKGPGGYGQLGVLRLSWVNHLGEPQVLEQPWVPGNRTSESGSMWDVRIFFYQNSVEMSWFKTSGTLYIEPGYMVKRDCGQLRQCQAPYAHAFGTSVTGVAGTWVGFGRVGFGSAISSRPPTPNP